MSAEYGQLLSRSFSIPHFGGLLLTALKGLFPVWTLNPMVRISYHYLHHWITSSTVDFAISTDSLGRNRLLDMKDALTVFLNLDFV